MRSNHVSVFFLSLLMVPCLSAASMAMQDGEYASEREKSISAVRELQKIVTTDGIERLEQVPIGGIKQWISIRGVSKKNPVLLMLHGGPGYPSMPTSWFFQRGWEEYFTVVQWDQRGSGKTFASTDLGATKNTLTYERMVADAEEMVAWLRNEFETEKIIVLGHSWGSVLGLELVRRKPQWLIAYVGIGQAIHSFESERLGFQFAIAKAREFGNDQAIRELGAITPYPQPDGSLPLESLYVQRKWVAHYGGVMHGRRDSSAETLGIYLSPEYTQSDLESIWKGNSIAEQALLPDALATDFRSLQKVEVPLFFFLGRHDHNVSSQLAAEWLEVVEAPSKKIVWFENSAHEVMNEEPGKLLVSLVEYVRPYGNSAE